MGRAGQYPPELRDRAVRMVAEVTPDYPSQWAAITAVAQKLGIGTAETLRKWVRRAEIDDGRRPGLTSQEHAEIKRLKRENAELRRANETLKAAASAFFAAELDRPQTRSSGSSPSTRTAPTVGCGGVSSRSVRCCPSTAAQSPRRPTMRPHRGRRRSGRCAMRLSRSTSPESGRRTMTSTARARSGYNSTARAFRSPAAPSRG